MICWVRQSPVPFTAGQSPWLLAGGGPVLPAALGLLGLALAVALLLAWRRQTRRRREALEELGGGGEEPKDALSAEPAPEPPAPVSGLVSADSLLLEVTPDELRPGSLSVARAVARATRSDGTGVSGVPVSLVADGGPVAGRLAETVAVTDADGRAVLELTVPLLLEGRRLYFTAEVRGEPPTLHTRAWIRVRDVALALRPERLRLQAGSGEWAWLEAVLRDDAGDPVSGVELRTSVVDAAGGPVEPELAVTGEDGRVEFAYTAGWRPGEVRVRTWPEGEPRLAAEIVVEQVE